MDYVSKQQPPVSAIDYEGIYDAEERAIIREMNRLDAQKEAHRERLKTLSKLKAELKQKAEVNSDTSSMVET